MTATLGAPLSAGETTTLHAQLYESGEPIALPDGEQWTWTYDESVVSLVPDPDDPTGATVVATLPDTYAGVLVISAAAADPTGAIQTAVFLTSYVQPKIYAAAVNQLLPVAPPA